MRRTELEQEILDYIVTLYNADYIGFLRVYQTDTSYTMELGMPSYMTRTNISCDADNDSDFMDFIKEELRTRNYMRLDIYKINRNNEDRQE